MSKITEEFLKELGFSGDEGELEFTMTPDTIRLLALDKGKKGYAVFIDNVDNPLQMHKEEVIDLVRWMKNIESRFKDE